MDKCMRWMSLITVEPVMFFYMFAFMLTSVIEQSFFVHVACRGDMRYSEEICINLSKDNFTEEKKNVQVLVSDFHQYNNIASHAIPIILALVLGSWSDRRGRKLPLMLGLMGKLYYVIMIIIIATQDSWPLSVVVFGASLPAAMTGADIAIFMACFSYLADVTTPENKTFRYGVLNNIQLFTMPTGVALGKYLFNVTNQSYVIMFSINACLLTTAMIYAFIRLEWLSASKQTSILLADNCFTDFFDKTHIINSVKTIVRKRPGNRRTYLIVLFISMVFYTFQRDEMAMKYLYTMLKFKWTENEFSDYRTFQSSAYVLGTLVGIPIFTKMLGVRDTLIIMIGAIFHSAARITFAFAEVPWVFYIGGGIASFGPIAAPVIRSMTSKVVPATERGIVFAVLSSADMAVRLFSGVIYSQVYSATINTLPTSIFWVTVASQLIVFMLALFIDITLGKNSLDIDETELVNQEMTEIKASNKSNEDNVKEILHQVVDTQNHNGVANDEVKSLLNDDKKENDKSSELISPESQPLSQSEDKTDNL